MYTRTQGERISLGRVELDFTPEWVPDPACVDARQQAGGEAAKDEDVRKIAVPRARILVRGSDKVLEIRDVERIQRLRRIMKPASRRVTVGSTGAM
jgi:hypothetical protein